MKKLFLSILAVAALASCSKNEAFYTEQDSEIKLNPVTAVSTRATDYAPVYGSIDGTNYPPSERFNVTAYWTNPGVANQSNVVYLDNVVFTNKGQYWGGTNTYYWPKNGYLQFACYSPTTVAKPTHDVATDTYTFTEYKQSNLTNATVDFLVAPTTVGYTAETATENVAVVFEHALSWITIQLKAKNPEAAKAFKVHDLIINNVLTMGTLTAEMEDGIQYNEWGNKTTEAAIDVVKGKNIQVGIDAAIAEDAPKGTVVIPQIPTTLTINYTQAAMGAATDLTNQTVTVPLELDDEANNFWEPGKHYIYTVIFDLDEILINPSVEDWEDVVVEDKDMDDAGQIATVATEDELLAALKANVKEIELTSTIELTSQLNVTYNVAFTNGGFTGKPIAVTGGVVSFENVAFANGTTGEESCVYVRNGNTNVTFDGCTFEDYAWEAIQYTSEDGLWVCVNNCSFKTAAHRDLHLQVKKENGGSKAEVKVTNNTFEGADDDSYVTIYGFAHERMILANNTIVGGTANTANVWISNGFDYNNLTLNGFVVPTAEAPAATLAASTVLGDDYNMTTLNLGGYDLDGNGHTLAMEKSTVTDFIVARGGYISNVTVQGYGARNDNGKVIYGIKLANLTKDVVLNNVVSKGFAYALNTGSGVDGYNLTVQNSSLEGWTSFTNKKATFINTAFTIGTFFANTTEASEVNVWNGSVKPYNTTVFDNCTFENGFNLILGRLADGATVTFKNCTVDGVKLTKENFTTYMKLDENKIIVVGGSEVYAEDADGNYISLWDRVSFE